jgi:hypothetical protein
MGKKWCLVIVSFATSCSLLFAFWFANQQNLIDEFCSTQVKLGCPTNFSADIEPIEKKFIQYKQSLKDKPIGLVATQVDRIIQMTLQSESTIAEELKTRYLHRRLIQRQKEIREKVESISLSPKRIRSLRSTYANDTEFLHAVRQYVVLRLVANWFTKFVSKPYGQLSGIYVDINWQYIVDQINQKDDLDLYLSRRWRMHKSWTIKNTSFYLSPKDIATFWSLYLFKNKEDLDVLWYSLVSNRERINTDVAYRRFNIKTAFEQIWPVRVLMPGESLSFLKDSNFDMEHKKIYKRGKVIASDIEVDDYGGGLCGAATAIYQWSVTNSWLAIQMRNHSKRYKNLYTATIDGQLHALPGIDATIYSPSLDLIITNNRPYPIIFSMNYDGTLKWWESVFTLWKASDRGSLEYVGRRNFNTILHVQWGEPKPVVWQCHTRLINAKTQERCYKEILN